MDTQLLSYSFNRRIAGTAALTLAANLAVTAQASVWSGGSGNWNNTGTPGWDIVPNAQGAVASKTDSTSATISINNGATVTVGSLIYSGSGNVAWAVGAVTGGNAIINFDNGASQSVIRNANTNSGGSNALNLSSTLTLTFSDLLVENTSNSTKNVALNITSPFSGSGQLTFSNRSNSLSQGAISIGGSSDGFTGPTLIRSGTVAVASAKALGTSKVTLGVAGGDAASFVSSSTSGTVTNNIVAAAGSNGALLIGSSDASTALNKNTVFSGTISIGDQLSIYSIKGGDNSVNFTNTISGAGTLTKVGSGLATLTGTNTYTGDTVVSEGTLTLAAGSELRFVIQDGGVSNQVLGVGAVNLNGLFRLDLSTLSSAGGIWQLVDTSNLTASFGDSFKMATTDGMIFNKSGTTYTSTDNQWQFDTATGDLVMVPEAATLLVLGPSALVLSLRKRRR